MLYSGLRILVTGCSGFLGPWLCQLLLENDAVVIGADINFDEHSRINELSVGPLSENLETVHLNVENFESTRKLIVDCGIQFVFHLAAQALVGVALEKPLETINTNVMGTANILDVARRLAGSDQALKGIVVASSDKAYGDQKALPYVESAPMQGRFPYDVSKSCADLIARSYFHSFALPVCVTRCGNLYGAGDLNYSRIVPGTIKSCLEGSRPIIHSDGTLVRDYINVEDAADAMFLIGQAMLKDDTIYGESFNISNDRPMTVLEIVNEIRKVTGREDLEPVVENTAYGEIKAQYLSSQRLRKRIGWAPRVELTEGLARAVLWYGQQLSSK